MPLFYLCKELSIVLSARIRWAFGGNNYSRLKSKFSSDEAGGNVCLKGPGNSGMRLELTLIKLTLSSFAVQPLCRFRLAYTSQSRTIRVMMSDVEIPSVLCVGANMPNPKTHTNTVTFWLAQAAGLDRNWERHSFPFLLLREVWRY